MLTSDLDTDAASNASTPGASRYGLVSADSHIIEPGDLWTSRLPRMFADRAPRTREFPDGDGWVLEGVAEPITFGLNAAAGTDVATLATWKRWTDINPAGYDARQRIIAMDSDGVDAEILYPTPRLAQYIANVPDVDFHVSLVRAYNDWLAEYCSHDPTRLLGVAVATNRGADRAVRELQQVMDQPGMVGVLLNAYPNGTLTPTDDDDWFWAWAQERKVPLSIHIALTSTLPEERRTRVLAGAFRLADAPDRVDQLIFSGILDRFPELRFVLAEVDCGWVPYFREQLENSFRRMGGRHAYAIRRTPTQYLDENVWFTFITDSFAVRHRHNVGIDRMLWSSDFPHNASDWPHSWRTINAAMTDVPAAERRPILAGNAVALYGLA